jgi:hypothetical protein
MATYINKKTGNKCQVTELENGRYVIVEDGNEKEVGVSTIKRWYKPVAEEVKANKKAPAEKKVKQVKDDNKRAPMPEIIDRAVNVIAETAKDYGLTQRMIGKQGNFCTFFVDDGEGKGRGKFAILWTSRSVSFMIKGAHYDAAIKNKAFKHAIDTCAAKAPMFMEHEYDCRFRVPADNMGNEFDGLITMLMDVIEKTPIVRKNAAEPKPEKKAKNKNEK